MFWMVIERAGLLLMTALMGKQFYDTIGNKIKSDSIYSTKEVAKLLKIEKADVIELILTGKLKAQNIKGSHRILGSSLIEMLSSRESAHFVNEK